MALTDTIRNAYLTHLHAGAAPTALTSPVKVALLTAMGSATTAGTEVTGGSYARQSSAWGSAASGSQATSAALTYASMPAVTVVGVDLYDSAGTPARTEFGTLTASKTTAAGDTLSIAAGALTSALA